MVKDKKTKEKPEKIPKRKPTPKAIRKYEEILALHIRVGDKVLVDGTRVVTVLRLVPSHEMAELSDDKAGVGPQRKDCCYFEVQDVTKGSGSGRHTVTVKKTSTVKRLIKQ